jgi:glutamine amidotransferase
VTESEKEGVYLSRRKTIQVLDYGSGNLFSIQNSIEKVSKGKVKVTVRSDFQQEQTDGLILPGVGSFSSAQKILEQNRERIIDSLNCGSLYLFGICLGMQLLFEKSEEGSGRGLSIFKGNVRRFVQDSNTKIPHMGWNTFKLVSQPVSKFCVGLQEESWAYYVHSYFPRPKDKLIVKAWTLYGRDRFPAIIEKEKILGTQFHPEKSGTTGLKLISNFVNQVIISSRTQIEKNKREKTTN